MFDNLSIKIILGSTRQGRFGDKPAKWIYDEVKQKPDVIAELLDLRDYAMPFFDVQEVPAMANGNYAHESVKKWAAKIKEADAFIVVTPEYNHGYPGALKNALDWLYLEFDHKPVGLVGVSNGAVGGGAAPSVEPGRREPVAPAFHRHGHQQLRLVRGHGDAVQHSYLGGTAQLHAPSDSAAHRRSCVLLLFRFHEPTQRVEEVLRRASCVRGGHADVRLPGWNRVVRTDSAAAANIFAGFRIITPVPNRF